MKNNNIKCEKGLALISLVIIIIVLMLLAAVSTYVVLTGKDSNSKPVNNIVNEVDD